MFSLTTPLRAWSWGDDSDITADDVRVGAMVVWEFHARCRPVTSHAMGMLIIILKDKMTEQGRASLQQRVESYMAKIRTTTFCKMNEPLIEKLENPATTGFAVRLEYLSHEGSP